MRLLFFTFLFSISAPIFSQDTIKLKDGEFEKDIFIIYLLNIMEWLIRIIQEENLKQSIIL